LEQLQFHYNTSDLREERLPQEHHDILLHSDERALQPEQFRIGYHRSHITSTIFVNEVSSSQTMANEARISSLHQEYDDLSEDFETIWRLLDQYEQSGQRNKGILIFYQTLVDDIWKRFKIVIDELLEIDDNEPEDLIDVHIDLMIRLTRLNNIDSSSTYASNAVANPRLSE
jgi:hypothetical protein